MNIFISWSGEGSKFVANTFRDWLPKVFHNSVKPWMSDQDISAGQAWSRKLEKKLKKCNFGLVCVTKKNLQAPWLLYEAGALSKIINKSFVVPLLIDLQASDIEGSPLSRFQAVVIKKEGIYRLVKSVNKALKNDSIDDAILRSTFDRFWSDIKAKLNEIPKEEDGNFYWDEYDSNALKDFVCLNQGELIQYMFLAGELHKELKTALNNKDVKKKKIKRKNRRLIDHLESKFADAVTFSFLEIEKMLGYRSSSSELPRVCLKVNQGPDGKVIVPTFRKVQVSYDSSCKVKENSGFLYVKKNGRYFFCNDIPKAAKSGEYVNPRLISDKVDSYKIKKKTSHRRSSYIDKKWVACWNSGSKNSHPKSEQYYRDCYKSTLIIPLTLRNNNLSKRFIKKINMKNVERTIFGYLCFDHIETNYFDEMFDVNAGYIFADILSLYLLTYIVYIDQSATHKKVLDFLE